MSEILDYINSSLNGEYDNRGVISETSVNRLTLFEHKKSGKRLVLIKSAYRNDDVFLRLKGYETEGRTPVVYEVCSEEDFLYVLEEYVEGKLLSDYMNGKEELEEKSIYKYLFDICSALELIHNLGIVHRDIKPENVIIRNNKACLIDFSAAKLISYGQQDTVNLGTAGYAAPEQFGVSGSTPAVDFYSFGVLANILLTGEHPTTLIPNGKIGKIIRKCTNIQISRRFQSAAELKNELRKIR